jgi:hypothetical protein
MSVQGNLTCANRLWETSISITIATRAKMLVDHAPGGLALPDSALFPSTMPQLTRGGQRIIGGVISSTDGTNRDVLIYRGSTLTTQLTANTGVLQVASTSTITRAAGDFHADGWSIGDALMVFGPPPTTFGGLGAPDYSLSAGVYTALLSVGVLAILTGVTATTLTVNGTPLSVELLPGCRLVRVAQALRQTVAANSGNAAATTDVVLIGGSNELDINNLLPADRGLSLGATDILAVAAQAAVSALPAQLNFTASSVLF